MRLCIKGQGKYVLAYKKSCEVLSKQKDIGYQATSLSLYDFSTLYTTLPHILIKEKLLDLIERTFYKKEGKLYLACNKANTSDTEALFLDLHLSISNGFVSSKIYDKRDDFDFDIVNFPFLDGDVPRRPSYWYISLSS